MIPAGRVRFLSVPRGADQVAGCRVTDGGSGYTGVPNVVIADSPDGERATAVAVLDGDAVAYIQITNPGSGYTAAPNVTFNGGGGSGAAATALLSLAGTNEMARRDLQGRLAGGVWVQGHTGAPGANGMDNFLTDIPRIQIGLAAFTFTTL